MLSTTVKDHQSTEIISNVPNQDDRRVGVLGLELGEM